MSWRLLFAVLLVALGASAWAGLQLGDWLVAHAPAAAPSSPGATMSMPSEPILDANGRPYVAQPPQPRIDGTLGVPDPAIEHDWTLNSTSLFDTVIDPNVQISRNSLTAEQARSIASGQLTLLPGASDIRTLDIPAPGTSAALNGDAPQQVDSYGRNIVQPPPPNSAPAPGALGWQDALKRDLARCSELGFFERPSCAWAARNKYCGPNLAWGTINECPERH